MRIVADTNTVVSGLLWSGPPQQLINAAREKRIVLYSSAALAAEFAEVVGREQFIRRIRAAGLSAAELVVDYACLVKLVVSAEINVGVSIAGGDAPLLELTEGAFDHIVAVVPAPESPRYRLRAAMVAEAKKRPACGKTGASS